MVSSRPPHPERTTFTLRAENHRRHTPTSARVNDLREHEACSLTTVEDRRLEIQSVNGTKHEGSYWDIEHGCFDIIGLALIRTDRDAEFCKR
ncbi:hypothetical protein EVAR_88422_1 [Eumeta japonica]|uniref:Uncharacterized protein n=1 Tax=Eumeta variegata TaxID=151549 RepID=A0A4C1XZR9_EUMVA|nr:hypothetical protein EVAR_88422_1 [Eumeta japonica]